MKFLVDAQLPMRVASALVAAGHDAVHTSDLPDGNRSTDAAIATRADADERVVVTKDADFRNSHLLQGSPRRLLVVATGNISNNGLFELIASNLGAIESAFQTADHVELRSNAVLVHGPRP